MKSLNFGINIINIIVLAFVFGCASAILFYTQNYFYAILFLFLCIIFFVTLLDREDRLLKIQVDNLKIIFYYIQNRKKMIKTFDYNKIKDFNLVVSEIIDYNKVPSKSRTPIELSFKVLSVDEELFVFNANLPELLEIAKVFDTLKNVPNFKYQVITNSDSFRFSIDEYACNNRKISLKESIEIMLNDPKVPAMTKDFIKNGVVFLKILLCIIIPMIFFIIVDVIKMLQVQQ